MANEHDRRYKKLFSHPLLFQELLESFVDEEFVKDLDFSTLNRLDKSFITDDFKEKESDLIYSINFRSQPVYIFLLLEFQSTVDKKMALRFLRYICEFYQSLNLPPDQKFPAVFPLLLYNGDPTWTAATSIEVMIEQTIPARYIPRFSYFPVLENTFPPEVLLQIKNVVSAIFFVENTGVESLSKELKKLYTLLKGEKHEIIELFIRWLKNYLEKTAEADNIDMGPLEDLEEVHNMFATSLEKYERRIAEKAMQQGIDQGVEQGKQQMLLRFAEKKFQLSDSERKGIQTTTDSAKLDRAFDVLINADSFSEVEKELE